MKDYDIDSMRDPFQNPRIGPSGEELSHEAYLEKMNIRPSKMAPGRMSQWENGVETVLGRDY